MPSGPPTTSARAGRSPRWAGVVDAAVVGRRDASTRSGGSARGCRSGRRPARRRSGRRAPASSRGTPRGALDPAGRVGVEGGHRVVDVPPGTIGCCDGDHLVREPLQLLPAPGVGLLEVDRGAEEVAGREGVVLAADASRSVATARPARSRGSGRNRRTPRWRRRVPVELGAQLVPDRASATRSGKKSPLAPGLPGPAARPGRRPRRLPLRDMCPRRPRRSGSCR